MKFFTEDFVDSQFGRPGITANALRATEQASEFSEEFFQGLYKREYEKFCKYGALKLQYSEPEREFEKYLQYEIAMWKIKLPDYILEKVKDIRVLALKVVSPRVKRYIELFAKKPNVSLKKTETKYAEYFAKIKKQLPEELQEGMLGLWDGEIEEVFANHRVFALTVGKQYWGNDKLIIQFFDYKLIGELGKEDLWNEECFFEEVDIQENGKYRYGLVTLSGIFEIEFSEIRMDWLDR